MINIRQANKYCKEDISKIENYDKAIADTTQVWHLHHRNEIRTLPSGITIIRTKEDLIDAGRYYGCNANELIFLTNTEHIRLHRKGKSWSEDARRKISESLKGKKRRHRSEETKKKISEALKGNTRSEETRKKISEANKGHTVSDETRIKISESHKGKHHTDESRRKIAESVKKRWTTKKKKRITSDYGL